MMRKRRPTPVRAAPGPRRISRSLAPAALVSAVLAASAFLFLAAAPRGAEAPVEARLLSSSTGKPMDARPVAAEKAPIRVSEPYRGFNLLGLFSEDWSDSGYAEEDFRQIRELGFNYVRLPVDYRTYADPSDWLLFREDRIREIDNTISWGQRYGIRVDLNLHRAPGFCINAPAERLSLWTDAAAQEAFIAHWEFFAKRYERIPPEWLSFGLVNEPYGVDGADYARIALRAVKAIRAIDPDRPVVSDGIEGGRVPVPELLGTGVIQSLHDYAPFAVSHYKAEWVEGSADYPPPVWPSTPLCRYLYGPEKREYRSPLVIRGDLKAGTRVLIRVVQVSSRSRIAASADGIRVFERLFIPGPGAGEWKKSFFDERWNIYRNDYDLECGFTLKKDAKELMIENDLGDWCAISRISFIGRGLKGGRADANADLDDWGLPQATFSLGKDGLRLEAAPPGFERRYAPGGIFDPWKDYLRSGGEAFVGEMGVYKFTPHDVALRYLEDQLKEIRSMGLGWALWNFTGPFGIIDSERSDVRYEAFHGRRLDRKMLELLKRY